MTVGVCLCGLPLEPLIGAERGGTAGQELTQFLKALGKGRKWILHQGHEGSPIVAAAKEQLATPQDLQDLEERLKTLQREVGRRRRLEPGPGRYWQLPTRQADSGGPGTLTVDRLALMLQQRAGEHRGRISRAGRGALHMESACPLRPGGPGQSQEAVPGMGRRPAGADEPHRNPPPTTGAVDRGC